MNIFAFSILSICMSIVCFGLGMLLQQNLSQINSNMNNLDFRLNLIENEINTLRGQNVGTTPEVSKKVLPREEVTDPGPEWR